jgi:hypothetical protein
LWICSAKESEEFVSRDSEAHIVLEENAFPVYQGPREEKKVWEEKNVVLMFGVKKFHKYLYLFELCAGNQAMVRIFKARGNVLCSSSSSEVITTKLCIRRQMLLASVH